MQYNELSAAFDPLLHDLCTASTLAALEDAGAHDAHAQLWQALESSGFLDCLVPEIQGGAGLTLTQAWGLLRLAGYHGLPAAFATTLLARAWLARRGVPPPAGSIAIAASPLHRAGDSVHCTQALFGLHAHTVLAEDVPGTVTLWRCDAASERTPFAPGSLDARFAWREDAIIQTVTDAPPRTPSLLCALASSCLMAGAAQRILAMSVDYANQRQQFGRSIGRFQAVQQQLSVMAQLAAAVDMAAQLACQEDAFPHATTTALAKCQASAAAGRIADMAHAVHGAIGVTQEYALQHHTRHLRAWRRCAGTESWWAQQLGEHLLAAPQLRLMDFIQAPSRAI